MKKFDSKLKTSVEKKSPPPPPVKIPKVPTKPPNTYSPPPPPVKIPKK